MADQRLSAETVRALAAQYPDWDPESVVRIAWRESNFVPTAFADDSDDLSYGLMQINMKPDSADVAQLRQMYGITNNEQLFDPAVNIRAAHVLWQAGGKSFVSGWNVVPPVAIYPRTGGSPFLLQTDDQGNPQTANIDLDGDGTKDVYISDWGANDAANWNTFKVAAGITGFNAANKTFVPASATAALVQAANFGKMPDDSDVSDSMKSTLDKVLDAITNSLSTLETLQVGVNEGIDTVSGITDWAAGLTKLLSVLTSLSFWKKVGVGVIALLLIFFAVGIFNKDKVLPMVTKGAVSG